MEVEPQTATEFARVAVDHDVCEASAVCTRMVPQVFELDEDDYLHIKKQAEAEDLDRRVRIAVRRCPKQALFLE